MTEADLTARLEKLERDNLWIKRLGMIAVVIAAALGAMHTASCSPAGRRSGTQDGLDKITAREFDMLDASGKVRAKIAMDGLFRPQGLLAYYRLIRPGGEGAYGYWCWHVKHLGQKEQHDSARQRHPGRGPVPRGRPR